MVGGNLEAANPNKRSNTIRLTILLIFFLIDLLSNSQSAGFKTSSPDFNCIFFNRNGMSWLMMFTYKFSGTY